MSYCVSAEDTLHEQLSAQRLSHYTLLVRLLVTQRGEHAVFGIRLGLPPGVGPPRAGCWVTLP